MNWISFSLLMFVFSNLLYLLIRKAQTEKIKTSIYSVTMFLIPSIIYLILALASGISLLPKFNHLIIIVITAFLWSYLGNYFSQRGILYAPNLGYSLILQKSYVMLTTIAAFFLFDSELSLLKIIAILIIVGFSALVSISKEKKKSDTKWVIFSFGAHLCFAYGSLISKYFLNIGLQPYMYLFYITFIVSLLNIYESRAKKISLSLSAKQWIILGGIGISAALFNLFMQQGYKYAPNPGYVVAINTSSIMSLTLLSAYIFKDNLSVKKIIGIVGITIGLFVIIF
ncbi:EamA family transporter [Patescibacteria group bacterium]